MAEANKDAPEIKEPPPVEASDDELEAQELLRRHQLSRKLGEKKTDIVRGGNVDMKKILGLSAIVTIAVILVMMNIGIGNWVTKKDFGTNLTNINKSLSETVASVNEKQSTIQGAIQAIPKQINDAVSQAINQVNANLNSVTNKVNGYQTTMDAITAKNNELAAIVGKDKVDIVNLQTEIKKLQEVNTSLSTQVAGYKTRIEALELKFTASGSTGGGVSGVIGIKSDVLEEGVLQTDNRTYSQIRLTITNLANSDLEDVSISAMVMIDNALSTRPTLSTVGWYIRDWDGNTLEIRSSSGYTLDAGQVKKVYLNIYSYAQGYQQGNVTFTDISNSDVEVRTYNVK